MQGGQRVCSRCTRKLGGRAEIREVKRGDEVIRHEVAYECDVCYGAAPLEMGVSPDEYTVPMGQSWCSSCGSRRHGTMLATFQELVRKGKTNDEAMKIVGINRFCCRRALSSYSIIPMSAMYDPGISAGEHEPDEQPSYPWERWEGNLRRVGVRKDGRGNLIESEDRYKELGLPDLKDLDYIPPGYKAVGWLEVPQSDSKSPLYVIKLERRMQLPSASHDKGKRKLTKEQQDRIDKILDTATY